jgi:hypothetical protein
MGRRRCGQCRLDLRPSRGRDTGVHQRAARSHECDRQRLCETHVGQRYWRWRVSANSTNTASRRLGGVALLRALEECGFRYDDGLDGPPRSGRRASECYRYTTIVGYEEFGYNQRPLYKRKPKSMRTAEFKTVRAAACAELITRVGVLADADPALDLRSHEVTRKLLEEPAPLDNGRTSTEKICSTPRSARGRHHSGIATASSGVRCSALPPEVERPTATIIAPARSEQRVSRPVENGPPLAPVENGPLW